MPPVYWDVAQDQKGLKLINLWEKLNQMKALQP